MKKQQFLLGIIILIITDNCIVNQQLPLKKVNPSIRKGSVLYASHHMMGKPFQIQDSLRYIRSEVQRNIMLGLILRYPFDDVFYSEKHVDPFSTSKRPFSRFHNYKEKMRYSNSEKSKEIVAYKMYDKERIIHDMLRFIIPPSFDLDMWGHTIDFFDSAEVYGITCKDSLRMLCGNYIEGPFSFYTISTDFKFKYNKDSDSLTPNVYSRYNYYEPFRHLEYGSCDSIKSLKKSRYIIAFNQSFITHPKSSNYEPHDCSKDILYLSKEFLQYESSVNYLRKVMQNHFNPDDPNTYIPYLKILAYSDYAGGDFVFVNKNKKRIKYKFYSLALKSYMQATITIAYPQSVKFKLLKR